MRLAAVVLAYVLGLATSHAQTKTGSELQAYCSGIDEAPDSFQITYCAGYVSGLLDGREAGFIEGYARGRRMAGKESQAIEEELERLSETGHVAGFCRKGQTVGQAIRIINRYLRTHPERSHEPAATLFIEILAESFPPPCRAPQQDDMVGTPPR